MAYPTPEPQETMVRLNEKVSTQRPTRARRVPLTARPLDFIYFSFFAVSFLLSNLAYVLFPRFL